MLDSVIHLYRSIHSQPCYHHHICYHALPLQCHLFHLYILSTFSFPVLVPSLAQSARVSHFTQTQTEAVCDARRLATLALIVAFTEGAVLTRVQELGSELFCSSVPREKKEPSVHRQRWARRRKRKAGAQSAPPGPPDIQRERVPLACKGNRVKGTGNMWWGCT